MTKAKATSVLFDSGTTRPIAYHDIAHARAKRGVPMKPAGDPLKAALQIEIERQVTEHSGAFPRDHIESCVGLAAQEYAGVRVATFVPVLVYRDVRDRLREHLGDPANEQED